MFDLPEPKYDEIVDTYIKTVETSIKQIIIMADNRELLKEDYSKLVKTVQKEYLVMPENITNKLFSDTNITEPEIEDLIAKTYAEYENSEVAVKFKKSSAKRLLKKLYSLEQSIARNDDLFDQELNQRWVESENDLKKIDSGNNMFYVPPEVLSKYATRLIWVANLPQDYQHDPKSLNSYERQLKRISKLPDTGDKLSRLLDLQCTIATKQAMEEMDVNRASSIKDMSLESEKRLKSLIKKTNRNTSSNK